MFSLLGHMILCAGQLVVEIHSRENREGIALQGLCWRGKNLVHMSVIANLVSSTPNSAAARHYHHEIYEMEGM